MDLAQISIICECEDTKTPLSKPITINNPIKEVRFDTSIESEFKVKLRTDNQG